MRKQNKITSMLFMFFFLLFDCLIRAGGSEWVEWIFADPIFLEEKDICTNPFFYYRHSYLHSACPPKTLGVSTGPVNDIDREVWNRLFYDFTVHNLM